MKNNGIADFQKPTIITAQQYGTKVTIEIDHSDTDIDELFDAFQTICVGLGYHDSTIKQWVIDRADEYKEEDDEYLYEPNEAIKEAVERYVANLPTEPEFNDYGQRINKKK